MRSVSPHNLDPQDDLSIVVDRLERQAQRTRSMDLKRALLTAASDLLDRVLDEAPLSKTR